MFPSRLSLSLSLRVWFLIFCFLRLITDILGQSASLSSPFLLQPHPSFLTSRSYFLFFPLHEPWHPCLLVWGLRNVLSAPPELLQPGNSSLSLQGQVTELGQHRQRSFLRHTSGWFKRVLLHAGIGFVGAEGGRVGSCLVVGVLDVLGCPRLLSFVRSKGESPYWMGVHSRALTQTWPVWLSG